MAFLGKKSKIPAHTHSAPDGVGYEKRFIWPPNGYINGIQVH